MNRRATIVNLKDRSIMISAEPILDTEEGVLILAFEDGTSRTFNWDYVIDYYYMTAEEYQNLLSEGDEE